MLQPPFYLPLKVCVAVYVSKSYKREGQPRKTENELGLRRFKPNPNNELNTKSNPKKRNQRKKLKIKIKKNFLKN